MRLKNRQCNCVDCYIFLLTSFPKTYFPRTIFPIDIFSQRHVFPVTFFPIYFFSYWLLFLQTCFPSVIFSQMTFFPIYFPKSRMDINLLFWNLFMFFCDQCLQKKNATFDEKFSNEKYPFTFVWHNSIEYNLGFWTFKFFKRKGKYFNYFQYNVLFFYSSSMAHHNPYSQSQSEVFVDEIQSYLVNNSHK